MKPALRKKIEAQIAEYRQAAEEYRQRSKEAEVIAWQNEGAAEALAILLKEEMLPPPNLSQNPVLQGSEKGEGEIEVKDET